MRRRVGRFVLTVAVVLAVVAVAARADSVSPDAHLPTTFSGRVPPATTSFGDLPWAQLYQDATLQSLIHTAISANFDVEIAVERVLQASEQVTIARANQLPVVSGALTAPTYKVNGPLPSIFPHQEFSPSLQGTVSYEADLWGQLSSATAASRAQLLATEDAREAVIVTLVSDVASAYFEMRAFDQELGVLHELLKARQKDLVLTKQRFEQGEASRLDVDQAQSLVEDTEADIPQVQQETEDAEIAISTLEGQYPRSIPRGLPLTQQVALPVVPAIGLPSALLERRPDIREAEQVLIAQHAQITVARAALFPQLFLAGTAGTGTEVVDSVFYGPHGLFSLVPALLYTVFNGGAQKAEMRSAEDQEKQDLYSYLSTIHQSFAEVTAALAGYQYLTTQAAELRRLTNTYRRTVDLSTQRYYEGEGSFTDVLDQQSRYLGSNIEYVEAELDQRLALVHLYEALGGGWQPVRVSGGQPAPATSH